MSVLSAFLDSLRATSGPSAAVELAANRIAGATVDTRGGRPVVAQHAVETLPDGALVPSLTAANVRDRRIVAGVLGRVLDRIGRPRRIALIVPDSIARVSIVKFEQVPTRADDLEQLIRWQVKKAAPFSIDEAQVSSAPGAHAPDGQEFLVTLARRDIVREYEDLCAEGGADAGVVDLSTLNVANAVLAADGAGAAAADWLLVNVAPDSATIAILSGAHVIFFRNRPTEEGTSLADLIHQSAMYYEDRLKGAGFARAVLAGGASSGPAHAAEVDQARRLVEERLGIAMEAIDPRGAAALTDRIAAGPALLDAIAPLVGVLLRERERAA